MTYVHTFVFIASLKNIHSFIIIGVSSTYQYQQDKLEQLWKQIYGYAVY